MELIRWIECEAQEGTDESFLIELNTATEWVVIGYMARMPDGQWQSRLGHFTAVTPSMEASDDAAVALFAEAILKHVGDIPHEMHVDRTVQEAGIGMTIDIPEEKPN